MRVLVTGSRTWDDRDILYMALDRWNQEHGIAEIIEGCAKGADSMAEDWAGLHGIPVRHFPADWTNHHKAAGPIRNSRMLQEGRPDVVLAFHGDLAHSKGTGDMVRKSRAAGLPVVLTTGLAAL